MSSASGKAPRRLPAVDERLVAEGRYEIMDGRIQYVPPAKEPHATRHAKLGALLEAYAADDFVAACDMLTRTSEDTDIAPDGSVFPRARDPETGGRQVEQLAFEIASTQRLADVAKRATKLCDRGVRRVFAIEVKRERVLEWSAVARTWEVLSDDASIDDPALATPLPVAALVTAARSDDAVARALLAKGTPVLTDALADAAARAARDLLRGVLQARALVLSAQEDAQIDACSEVEQLRIWATRAATATTIEDVFDGPPRGRP